MRKKFRVAVEGQTTDKRNISRQDILDMAKNYNPQTYGARIWMEHYRSAWADSPFKAYGDVISCTAEEIKDGDLKGKMALYAEIDATQDMVALAKAKQKVYFSVEIQPDFPVVGGAYLVGLGFTDSPASLGTEYIQFSATAQNSPLAARKQKPDNFISTAESEWAFTEEAPNEGSLFSRVMDKLRPKQQKNDQQFSDIEKCFQEVTTFCTELKTELSGVKQELAQAKQELAVEKQNLAAFKHQIDKTPSPQHHSRPISTGGDGSPVTDC